MSNVLVPELSVRDWQASLRFYCECLGFSCRYAREAEGFAFLEREGAALMIDQIGLGRDFDAGLADLRGPLGRGVNLQIRATALAPICVALEAKGVAYIVTPEERWYAIGGGMESGQRQVVIADPDGYLLRLYEELGARPAIACPDLPSPS
ncbi:glyoxalase [Xaviernesmea oryzae]|uniref:Bleomycin resistance protein n=1 Tax=Xaviernesmea oryzae TaxID=464029 RepID=A0A1Q9AX94_9HYPH|nr:VOC family protein [Xaviernesmea oryzae]OLP60082.1 glyoxalase [Xaviernesmea oryzae]SEK37333.1 Catechol 2,3-dioxygenase [Xaviernesmea oryzae]